MTFYKCSSCGAIFNENVFLKTKGACPQCTVADKRKFTKYRDDPNGDLVKEITREVRKNKTGAN